jgi:hypothetical protein
MLIVLAAAVIEHLYTSSSAWISNKEVALSLVVLHTCIVGVFANIEAVALQEGEPSG